MRSKRVSKDTYYLDIARAVSKRSTCLKRHYGCVIVKNDEIIASGYNGAPRGEVNCCDIYEECPRKNVVHNSGDYSDCSSVHAEQNAMLSASRRDMIGATMYLYCEELMDTCGDTQKQCADCVKGGEHKFKNYNEVANCVPCPICKRMIANSGIERVVNREGDIKWE